MTPEYEVRVYQVDTGFVDWLGMWSWEVMEVHPEPEGDELPPLALGMSGATFTRWGARREARKALRGVTATRRNEEVHRVGGEVKT